MCATSIPSSVADAKQIPGGLLDNVIQILGLDNLDPHGNTDQIQKVVHHFEPRLVGSTFVDYDPVWNAVGLNCFPKEITGCSQIALL